MIGSLMTYGALSTKAKALFGRRLRFGDYERMAALGSAAELLEDLQQLPGWAVATSKLRREGGYVGRMELEAALWEQVYADYGALNHFVPREDRLLMEFPVLLAEQRAILAALRRLKANQAGEKDSPQPLFRGKVDTELLARCTNFEELLAACRGSLYYSPLLRLRTPAPGPPPDYTAVEALLQSAYFSHMYRVIHRNYEGETRAVLLRSYGEQVDLLNIIHILRLKTYFPGETDYVSVLFPFNYRLRPELVRDLCAAPDAAGVFSLLRTSPYAQSFEDVDVTDVEDYYRRAFYRFNRRQLTQGRPCVYTAVAYLNLKQQELEMLVNVIESVKYGVPYDASFARLIGV